MVRSVARDSRMASAAARRSPRTSVRSEASIATSVPVPIARPRSACASAAASLTPSPTIATTLPCCLQSFDLVDLFGGQHLGDHLVDVELPRDRVRGAAVVAGEQHGRETEVAQFGDRRARGLLDGVGDDDDRADRPSTASQIAVLPSASA